MMRLYRLFFCVLLLLPPALHAQIAGTLQEPKYDMPFGFDTRVWFSKSDEVTQQLWEEALRYWCRSGWLPWQGALVPLDVLTLDFQR